jgi:hypothetical protein
MPDEPVLRQKARSAIENGRLPVCQPDRIWGGPGIGAPCAVCDLPVKKEEVEFEIQFERNGAKPSLDRYHVHIRCFAAWEFERKNAGGVGPRSN